MKKYFVVLCILFITMSLAQAPDTVWTKTYGGTEKDFGCSAAQTTDGGYIITGETTFSGSGMQDVWFLKTDASLKGDQNV